MAHSNACMPPSDPPATAASRSMPSSSRNARSVAHHVGDGDDRKVRPVRLAGRRIDRRRARSCRGIRRAGWCETTKKRSVSNALPGPIMPSHQPSPFAARAVAILGAEAVARALRRRRFRDAGGVRVAAQRVADEDDVVARRGQGAVGFVGDADRDAASGRSRARAASANRGTASRPCRPSPRRSLTLTVAMRATSYAPSCRRLARHAVV